MNLFEYALLAFGSLFVIVDPLAAVPAFLAMTMDNSHNERIRMARLACITTAVILILMALAGRWFFKMLGITYPAFHIAGGLVMVFIAYDMLRAQRSTLQETVEEKEAGAVKEDIAVTPLAVPMLAGPGAIVSVILLEDRAISLSHQFLLYGVILLVCSISYFILSLSAKGAYILGPIAMKIMTRLMGLFLMAVAVQFVLNGVSAYIQTSNL
jgi:multiple antibiotic resistance protein